MTAVGQGQPKEAGIPRIIHDRLSLQVLFQKGAWGKELDVLVFPKVEKVFVPRYDDIALRGKSAGDEFVVVWISANVFRQVLRFYDDGLSGKQHQGRGKVNPLEFKGQFFPHASILFHYGH